MSKLASIQKIINIKPIQGADNIELAFVLGWQVVIKKGEYKINDLITYIQIDTVVPNIPEFEFLKERKFRVKTIKLRKELSQGLIIPLPIGNWKEGDDVTELLKINKYEKQNNNPLNLPKIPKTWYKKMLYYFKYNYLYKWFPFLLTKERSPFPKQLVSITDEERIQNIPNVLETHRGKEFIVSYKLDGSSITIIYNKGKFRICSRRFELHNKKNDWFKVFTDTNFKNEILKLVTYFKTDNIIVQGEAIGKFNGNHHNLNNEQIRLFNIYVNGIRLDQQTFVNVCKSNNIPFCPVFDVITLNHTLSEILDISKIKDILNPNVEAEGLVWRCIDDNLSFKVINNNYLLKEK